MEKSGVILKAELKVQATAQETSDLKREAYWFCTPMISLWVEGYRVCEEKQFFLRIAFHSHSLWFLSFQGFICSYSTGKGRITPIKAAYLEDIEYFSQFFCLDSGDIIYTGEGFNRLPSSLFNPVYSKLQPRVSQYCQVLKFVLQCHTVQYTSGFVHEQEVVLQPVVLYHTQLTMCSREISRFWADWSSDPGTNCCSVNTSPKDIFDSVNSNSCTLFGVKQ